MPKISTEIDTKIKLMKSHQEDIWIVWYQEKDKDIIKKRIKERLRMKYKERRLRFYNKKRVEYIKKMK